MTRWLHSDDNDLWLMERAVPLSSPLIGFLYGARIKLKHKLTGLRLHSLNHKYPAGSGQQMVTCYMHDNDDDWWVIMPAHGCPIMELGTIDKGLKKVSPAQAYAVSDRATVRLMHWKTGRFLHSHDKASHVAGGQHEVTCYGDAYNKGNYDDNWRVHFDQDADGAIRLEHVQHKGFLHSHGLNYNFEGDGCKEQEVTRWLHSDDNDLWCIDRVISPAAILYHGTSSEIAADVLLKGLIISTGEHVNGKKTGARIGPGVYFTPVKSVAESIARSNHVQGGPCILTCEVELFDQRRQYNWDHGSLTANGPLTPHSKFWSNHGFVSAFAMHPPWGGVDAPLPEICVHNIGHVSIGRLEVLITSKKIECKGKHPIDGFGGCGNLACKGKQFCVVNCAGCPDAILAKSCNGP